MGMKEFVCFKSCSHVGKLSVLSPKNCWTLSGLRNAYHGVLWALEHSLYKYPGIKMKGCHYVANSSVWCVSFLPFSVLSSEAIHIYARKMFMCLLLAKAIGLMERAVPGAVSQVFRHNSLSLRAPTSLWFYFSFLSRLCFSFLFCCISCCGCAGCSCFPGAVLLDPASGFSRSLSLRMLSPW